MTPTPSQPAAEAIAERAIQTDILKWIAGRSDLRIWRANCGAAETATGRIIKFGIKGQADLSGILGPAFGARCGVRLEIEVKTATGRQSPAQKNFQRMIEAFGGAYVLARSVEDVEAALAALRIPEPTA